LTTSPTPNVSSTVLPTAEHGHGVKADTASGPLASTGTWLPGLDVLRGIAAAAVVVHHSFSLGGHPDVPGTAIWDGLGSWGVGLFFVLSGYLLCDFFWRPRRQASLKVFWVRRIFRVAPAYYAQIALLFLFFAAPALLMSEQGVRQILTQITFTHYYTPNTASSLNVNGALWTLSIEMTLYLVMPLLALFVGWPAVRGRRALLWPMTAVALLIAFAVGYRLLVAFQGGALQSFYFGDIAPEGMANARLYLARQFPGWVGLFALGIGLRWLVHQRYLPNVLLRPTRHRIWVFVVLFVPSLLWLQLVYRGSNFTHPFLFATFDLILGALLLPALLYAARPSSSDEGTATIRAGVWLGEHSYGLYLWHFPVILVIYERGTDLLPPDTTNILFRLLLIWSLAMTLAVVSYNFVEVPARDYGRRLSRRIAERQARAARETTDRAATTTTRTATVAGTAPVPPADQPADAPRDVVRTPLDTKETRNP
jgi:peptidoglycan/LPS O-acetylase OafA/YrhL